MAMALRRMLLDFYRIVFISKNFKGIYRISLIKIAGHLFFNHLQRVILLESSFKWMELFY